MGFDFDLSSQAHQDKKALSADDLAAVEEAARRLPYVEAIRSRGGVGLHLWVALAGEVVANERADHKLAAAAVLAQMTKDANFPFGDYIDVFGGNMWVWHRETKPGGFQILKPATESLTLPANWRETGEAQSRKLTDRKLGKAGSRHLNHLVASNDVAMDDKHRAIQTWCIANGWPFDVETRNGKPLTHVHTAGLKAYAAKNPIKGIFDTVSTGNDRRVANAFAFFARDGGLIVRRYGDAAEEWKREGNWSVAKYNVQPTYDEACRTAKGRVNQQGYYVFSDGNEEIAFKQLGFNFTMPEALKGHIVKFKRDGEVLFLSVREQPDDPKKISGWELYRKYWQHTIAEKLPIPPLNTLDHLIRHTVKETGGAEEWLYCDDNGIWQKETFTLIEKVIKSEGITNARAAATVIAHHAHHNWTLTKVPFGDEYQPGNRLWNRDGAKYAFDPAPGPHSHWELILTHCGGELDGEVAKSDWCKQNGVKTGGDFLRLWLAVILRKPSQSLPMLFFHSPYQNSGKSSFHRAAALMFKDGIGVCEIKKELTKDDFNDPYEGCVLGYIEEINISESFAIYEAIKNMIDADRLKLRGMYSKGRMIPNYMHLVQCANSLGNANVPPGDTRIMPIFVRTVESEIPWKDELRPELIKEGPAFLHTLLNLSLPQKSAGRLCLPVLETDSKRQAMADFEEKYRGWYFVLRELAMQGLIENKTADEVLGLLASKSNDETLPKNAGALARALEKVRTKLVNDGFIFEYQPPDGRIKPTFTIRPGLQLAA